MYPYFLRRTPILSPVSISLKTRNLRGEREAPGGCSTWAVLPQFFTIKVGLIREAHMCYNKLHWFIESHLAVCNIPEGRRHLRAGLRFPPQGASSPAQLPTVITHPDALVLSIDSWIINSSMAEAGFLYSKRNPYTILTVAPATHNIVSQGGIREKKCGSEIWVESWLFMLNPLICALLDLDINTFSEFQLLHLQHGPNLWLLLNLHKV